MASDSLSIRDVGKRAPDLTGDAVKFDFLASRVLKNTGKIGTIIYASSVAFGFLGKLEKEPQIRRFSLPLRYTHINALTHMRCFFCSKTKTSRDLFYGVVSKAQILCVKK